MAGSPQELLQVDCQVCLQPLQRQPSGGSWEVWEQCWAVDLTQLQQQGGPLAVLAMELWQVQAHCPKAGDWQAAALLAPSAHTHCQVANTWADVARHPQ